MEEETALIICRPNVLWRRVQNRARFVCSPFFVFVFIVRRWECLYLLLRGCSHTPKQQRHHRHTLKKPLRKSPFAFYTKIIPSYFILSVRRHWLGEEWSIIITHWYYNKLFPCISIVQTNYRVSVGDLRSINARTVNSQHDWVRHTGE